MLLHCCYVAAASNRSQVRGVIMDKLALEADSFKAMRGLFLAALAELFGTAGFLFLATGAVAAACHAEQGAASQSLTNAPPGSCFQSTTNLLLNSWAFGLAIFLMLYGVTNISGGHLNPAVTAAFFVTGKCSLLRALVYIGVQIAGACIGSGLVKAVDPTGFKASLGAANVPATWTTIGHAWGVEFILTALLVFVVFAATDARRNTLNAFLGPFGPFAIGLLVTAGCLVAIPIDGASINPARSFGPAAVSGTWKHHWIFWVAPLIGGCIAGLLYQWLADPHALGDAGEVHQGELEGKGQPSPAGPDAYSRVRARKGQNGVDQAPSGPGVDPEQG